MSSSVLLTAPVNTALKKMTIPMMFGLMMLMSFNLVDTFFISLLGTQALAAFSFTFPVTFTLISLAIGLGVGVSAVVARTLGQKNKEMARQHATVALVMSLILIYGMGLLELLLLDPIFTSLGASQYQMTLIGLYMTPWLLGCAVIIMPMIGNSVMRASGDTKTPAKVMALGALINALLDPLFIFGFGPIEPMGIAGAAIASLIASSVSCCLVYYRLTVTYRLLGWGYSLAQGISSAKKVLVIALPAAASNMMTPISTSIVTAIVASYGSEAVAAFGVGSRIESFAIIVVLALSMSLPPFISQNFGAGQYQRVKQAYFSSIKFVVCWQLAIYLTLMILSEFIAKIFADDPKVIEIIVTYLMIVPITHGLIGITILSNSTLNALHQPMMSVKLNMVRLFVLLVPLVFLGGKINGINGIFIGAACAAGISGLISYLTLTRQLAKYHQHESNVTLDHSSTVEKSV
jgi:putative MATE family efflux protein